MEMFWRSLWPDEERNGLSSIEQIQSADLSEIKKKKDPNLTPHIKTSLK